MLLSFQGAYFLRKSAALASATLTARKRRAQLAQLRSPGSVLGLTPWHVSQLLAGKRAHPHSARSFLKALRGMIAVAIVAGLCESDPAAGIRVKVPASRGYTTWTEDDISRFETAYPIGTKARLALALLLYTCQRRGDVIRMGRQHVKGGFLTVRQSKTGATVAIPLHPELQAILAASGASNLTFLTTASRLLPVPSPIGLERYAVPRACRLAYRRTGCAKRCAEGSPRPVARQIRLPRFQAMPRFGKLAGTRKRPIRNAWPRPRWRSFSEHQMANLYSLKWLPFRKSLKRKDSKVTMLVCSGPAHQALRPRHPRRAKDRPRVHRFSDRACQDAQSRCDGLPSADWSPPTRFVFSFTHSLTISAISAVVQ